jgi:hypothetical protein
VDTETPHHFSADSADADQLIDGAERMSLSIRDDLGGLRRADAWQQAEDTWLGGVEVHDAVDTFGGVRQRRRHTHQARNDDGADATHARLSAAGRAGCPG